MFISYSGSLLPMLNCCELSNSSCLSFLKSLMLRSCIGTYRTPFSERQKIYLKCFPRSPSHFSPSTLTDSTEAMDVRLRLLAETLSATEEGLSVRLNGMEEFESWHHAMTGAFQKIDNCTRILLPLRGGLNTIVVFTQ